jgi:hypothetical protein
VRDFAQRPPYYEQRVGIQRDSGRTWPPGPSNDSSQDTIDPHEYPSLFCGVPHSSPRRRDPLGADPTSKTPPSASEMRSLHAAHAVQEFVGNGGNRGTIPVVFFLFLFLFVYGVSWKHVVVSSPWLLLRKFKCVFV